MDSTSANILIDIFSNFDVFLIILVRLVGFITIVPILGGRSVPLMTRMGFSCILASIIYTSGMITEAEYVNSVFGYTILIFKEFFVGFLLGFVVFFIFNITYLTGEISDHQIGFSMASVFDPQSQMQVPISGNIYYNIITIFFVLSGGYRVLIKTIFYSYEALPIGVAKIVENEKIIVFFVDLITRFFKVGIIIALPIIAIILVMDVALGVLVKAVPKMNVFVIGMPAKVLVGLFGIWLIMPVFVRVYEVIYEMITGSLIGIIKVLMP